MAHAQSCLGENRCSSQLMRLDVNNSILQNGGAENFLPVLDSLARSTFLRNTIVKKYQIEPIAFPHNRLTCEKEKERGNRRFKDIDCQAANLCQKGVVDKKVREMICFTLPCTLLEGTRNEGACDGETSIFSQNITFPEPVELNNITIDPTSIDFDNGKANVCFSLTDVVGKVSARLELDVSKTKLPDDAVQVTDVKLNLDRPKKVCVAADINIASPNPISNIVITPEGGEPFISNQMIKDAAMGATVSGLQGYEEEDIEAVKNDLLPVLFHPLREEVERGVKEALEGVFEEELTNLANTLEPTNNNTALYMDSSNILGGMNVANATVGSHLPVVECALLQANSKLIPSDHDCIGMKTRGGDIITPSTRLDTDWIMIGAIPLPEYFENGYNIDSLELRKSLTRIKSLIESRPFIFDPESIFDEDRQRYFFNQKKIHPISDINKLVAQIDKNRLDNSTKQFIGITDSITTAETREIGLIVPDLCSATNPSSHVGRKIRNCAAQAYMDLDQMNSILKNMFDEGNICISGKGRENTCRLQIAPGFNCTLQNAPQIQHAGNKRFRTDIQLSSCYKSAVGGVLGEIARSFYPGLESFGSFGGDFNVSLNSKLEVDDEGNVMIGNDRSKFELVPGTGTGGLDKEDSWNRLVEDGLDKAVAKAMSSAIKVPVRDFSENLVGYPLEATGDIDSGDNFLGVCFKPARKH